MAGGGATVRTALSSPLATLANARRDRVDAHMISCATLMMRAVCALVALSSKKMPCLWLAVAAETGCVVFDAKMVVPGRSTAIRTLLSDGVCGISYEASMGKVQRLAPSIALIAALMLEASLFVDIYERNLVAALHGVLHARRCRINEQ